MPETDPGSGRPDAAECLPYYFNYIDLVPDGDTDGAPVPGAGGGDFDDEIDLRAEDDALIAAELEAAEAARAEEEERRAAEAAAAAEADEDDDDQDDDEDEDEDAARKRRRGRRGGRGRRKGAARELEGTFDHGEEGYGLWLDPAVADNPVYSEHWAGHRAVTVTVEPEAITIRRADAGRGARAEDPESDEDAGE